MERVAQHLLNWVEDVDLIVTSPYLRARQTAQILSQFYKKAKVVEAPELVPQSPPTAFLKWLKAHGREMKDVMVVGHEPHLSSFLSFLVAGTNESFVELKKSGVASVEVQNFQGLAPGGARLNWLVQPSLVI